MNAVVVDTDIVSFLFKGHPAASPYKSDRTGNALVVSFMTLAELDRWPIQAHWGDSKRDWLKRYLEPFALLTQKLKRLISISARPRVGLKS